MQVEDEGDMERFYQRIEELKRDGLLTGLSEEERLQAYPIQLELRKTKDRYRVLELLAQGGMKSVYLVKDLKLGQTLVMAKPRKTEDEEAVESFLREALLTIQLQHPNIITVYDLDFDTEGVPYFTMELMQGHDFQHVIDSKTFNESQLLEVFGKVCDATAYAHSKNILHLDLKPENIQIGTFGEVHLCDWGLAKIVTDNVELDLSDEIDPDTLNHVTLHGKIKGSPGYMAPEQAESDREKDVRTDIYALGAILYTIFTGSPPIRASNLDELIQHTIEGRLLPIAEDLHVGKGMQAIIYKCLALNPDERYQSVKELQRDLDNYFQGFATIAEDASFLTHFSLLIRRCKKEIAVFTAVFLFSSILLAVAFFRIENAREAAVIAGDKALEQMHLAEKNYDELRKEQTISESLRKEARILVLQIARSPRFDSPIRSIQLLESSIALEPDLANRYVILRKLARLYFVVQDFERAKQIYYKIPNRGLDQLILDASILGARLQSSEMKLSHSDAAEVLKKIHRKQLEIPLRAFYLNHMQVNAKSQSTNRDYLPLASLMLNVANNFWGTEQDERKLIFKGKTLKIAYHSCSQFVIDDINILKPLKFDTLDLSYTSFFEFRQLSPLRFKRLNIAGCRLNQFFERRIVELKRLGLKEIVLDSRFLGDNEIELLKKHFSLTDLSG